MSDIPLDWQVIKLMVSVALVFGLGMIAVHSSPRIAGLVAGYPLGTALALFFIGVEISPRFASDSAVHTLAGFTATLALCGGYLVAGRRDGLSGAVSGCLGGMAAWMVVGWGITQIDFNRMTATLTTLMGIALFGWLFRHVADVQVKTRLPLGRLALILRAGFATAIIFVITILAHLVPSAWAGTLAAFPVTLLPFLVMLHASYGAAPAATVIKHYPMGLGALLGYTLCVSLTYASWGLVPGTLTGFAIATLWLVGWSRFQQMRSDRA